MQQYNMKAFDYNAVLDIQRKNMEAFSEAGKLALEGFQAVNVKPKSFRIWSKILLQSCKKQQKKARQQKKRAGIPILCKKPMRNPSRTGMSWPV
jgi:hypothetical protein